MAASLVGVFTMLMAVLTQSALGAPNGLAPVIVRPGGVLRQVVTGFAPDTPVSQRLIGETDSTTLMSDASGAVQVAFRVPRRAGRYRLTLVGAVSGQAPTGPDSLPPGQSDVQAITVGVPKLAVIPVTVKPGGLGVKGVHRHRHRHTGGSTPPGSGSGPGGTSDTGVDVEVLLELAGVVLTCGLIIFGAGGQPRQQLPGQATRRAQTDAHRPDRS